MNKNQINELKRMMEKFRLSKDKKYRDTLKPQLLAYLAACLDGIE